MLLFLSWGKDISVLPSNVTAVCVGYLIFYGVILLSVINWSRFGWLLAFYYMEAFFSMGELANMVGITTVTVSCGDVLLENKIYI